MKVHRLPSQFLYHTCSKILPGDKSTKMPTNFTVVPVEDVEDGSSSGAAAGEDKPISLSKIFQKENHGDNLQESHSGRNTLEDRTGFWVKVFLCFIY